MSISPSCPRIYYFHTLILNQNQVTQAKVNISCIFITTYDRLCACYLSMTVTKWVMPPWQQVIWTPEYYMDSLCASFAEGCHHLCYHELPKPYTPNLVSLTIWITFNLSRSCIRPCCYLIFLSIKTSHPTIFFLMWSLSSKNVVCVCVGLANN